MTVNNEQVALNDYRFVPKSLLKREKQLKQLQNLFTSKKIPFVSLILHGVDVATAREIEVIGANWLGMQKTKTLKWQRKKFWKKFSQNASMEISALVSVG